MNRMQERAASPSETTRLSFGDSRDAYLFFQQQSTESANTIDALVYEISERLPDRLGGKVLDFGAGDGVFLHKLFYALGTDTVPSSQITVVEPDPIFREAAAQRLRAFSIGEPTCHEFLRDVSGVEFNAMLANHSLYFVEDIAGTVTLLQHKLAPGGFLFATMACSSNAIVQISERLFSRIQVPRPLLREADLNRTLVEKNVAFSRRKISSTLRFEDNESNRRLIVRFCLGPHFSTFGRRGDLLDVFDDFKRGDEIVCDLDDFLFAVRKT